MTQQVTCNDCGTSMEIGFIPDTGMQNIPRQPIWYPGILQQTIGLPGFQSNKVKLPDRSEGCAVMSYRCPNCGMLKFFAHPEQL